MRDFEIPEDLRSGYGWPQITREDKELILGGELCPADGRRPWSSRRRQLRGGMTADACRGADVRDAVAELNRALRTHGGAVECAGGSADTLTLRMTGLCAACVFKPITTEATIRPFIGERMGMRVEIVGARISTEAQMRRERALAPLRCERHPISARDVGGADLGEANGRHHLRLVRSLPDWRKLDNQRQIGKGLQLTLDSERYLHTAMGFADTVNGSAPEMTWLAAPLRGD